MHPPRSYEFGRFHVDVVERTLLYDGREIPLTQKAFDLLLTLVERGGQIASKDELLSKVWPNQFVDEGNLTQNIYTLRKILGETEGGRQYIETVPRRGYRFKPAVAVRRRGASAQEPSSLTTWADDGMNAGPREAIYNFTAGSFEPPETRYVRNGDLNIAYQVVGSGPLDLVFVMGWVSHLEYFWKEESFSRFLRRLASF
jgi:DNA-binding winged helix-turn-helix (wHTH) protein